MGRQWNGCILLSRHMGVHQVSYSCMYDFGLALGH